MKLEDLKLKASKLSTDDREELVVAGEEERRPRERRGELARQLLGVGRKFSPDRDAVSELVEERETEG